MPLSTTQKQFVISREPFPAFVGGFGSGKTAAAIARAMALKSHFPNCDIAYYLPTYPLVEDIAFRRFPELCERKGWAYKLNKSSANIEFPGAGRIIFRTMENPERIVGYEVAHSILDELDTLKTEKAREVWNKVIARNRQKCSMGNTVSVATTPEGFRFVYERWVRSPAKGYVIFKAKTQDNADHLPAGYIENLKNSYPEQLLSAYLDGEFVNLTAGTVFNAYNRLNHRSNEEIKPKELLNIGMDFNVTNMSAVVYVIRGGQWHAVDELKGIYDTPVMIQTIKDRYPEHPIRIYPDASGGSRKTVDASKSDISLLGNANFQVYAKASNPPVKDRILATNMAFTQGILFINDKKCPEYADCMEQLAYDKNGSPDKASNLDHLPDAGTYPIAYEFPINKPMLFTGIKSAY